MAGVAGGGRARARATEAATAAQPGGGKLFLPEERNTSDGKCWHDVRWRGIAGARATGIAGARATSPPTGIPGTQGHQGRQGPGALPKPDGISLTGTSRQEQQ